jgi:hypothetical protein
MSSKSDYIATLSIFSHSEFSWPPAQYSYKYILAKLKIS